jgi:hypothetical protein
MSVMKKWLLGGTLILLGFVVNPAQAQWGSRAGMYSEDGVQVGVDQRVFSVLTMLNQHGFNEDPYLGPEPIKTPQISETRQRVRGLMRRKGPVQKSFGKFIEKNAQAFPWYIASSLKVGKGPSFETTMKDEKVVRSMGTMMHDWFHEEGGSGFYDIAVKMNKNQQVSIVEVINTQTAALQNTLVVGDSEDALLEEELNPIGRVVVVIAPMAPHDYLARFDIEDVTFVVTGPWKKEGHINEIAEVVSVAYGRTIIAAQVALQEDGLKRYQKIFDKWSGDDDLRPPDVATMVSEMMACAAHQITHEKETCLRSPALADEKGSKAVRKMKAKLTKLAVEGAVFSAILPDLLKK